MAGRSPDDDDKAARFGVLVLPCLDEMYTLARYLLGNATDAEDAVQESCARALRYFHGFHGGPIKPWLFAILRNVCHAARAAHGELILKDAIETSDNDDAGPLWIEPEESPECAVLRRHDAETVRRLLTQLPAMLREVLVLREINDLPYRDIADVIDAPIGTVMSRLARARTMLRAAWIAAEGKETAT